MNLSVFVRNLKNPRIIFIIVALLVSLLLPTFSPRYIVQTFITVALYVALVGAWNILSGFTGYLFLGVSAFYGIGAYVYAIMSPLMPYYVTILVAGAICFVIAFLIGMPFLKIRGPYFTIASYALVLLFGNIILYYEQVVTRTTGRWISMEHLSTIYTTLVIVCFFTFLVAYLIKRSKLGYGLFCIRGNEDVANVIGINTFRYKCLAFGICAFFIGLISAAITPRSGYIDTTIVFATQIAFTTLVMGVFGGLGSLRGGLLSAFLISLLLELFATRGDPYPFLIGLGILLFIIIYFVPKGLESVMERVEKRLKKSA
ncbi:MAG: branched-chain amino acid ABC transporter permease [Candidatus Hadarchaeales archaeon]